MSGSGVDCTRIAVIGAGVIGLTSALRIAQEIPGVKVTVIADRLEDETTSAGAAGLWEPYKLSDTPAHLVQRWGKETFDYWRRLLHSAAASESGVSEATSFQFWTEEHPEDPEWRDVVPHFHRLTSNELEPFNVSAQAKLVDGWSFSTLICEGLLHLKWLEHQLQDAGGAIKHARIQSLSELQGFDLVVDCSGLGAYTLFGDKTMYPIKGHVVRVSAPWLKHVYFTDEETYVIPNKDSVVLGGTGYVGSWDTDAKQNDRQSILHRCQAMVPSLAKAEFIREWVGLRPGRPSVRLEMQQEPIGPSGKSLAVVHNYGHGGAGLTLSWGCAGHTVEIINSWLATHRSSRVSHL